MNNIKQPFALGLDNDIYKALWGYKRHFNYIPYTDECYTIIN